MIRRTMLALCLRGGFGSAIAVGRPGPGPAGFWSPMGRLATAPATGTACTTIPTSTIRKTSGRASTTRAPNDLYYRYPPEMRVPVYNKQWHNMYPEGALYHTGHHFLLDTF